MKWPLIPTILVSLAVATMVGLGIWQLQRKGMNEILLRQVSANISKPAIAYPQLGPVDASSLHRKSLVTCLRVVRWVEDSGSDNMGNTGTRYLAECATGAEGPGALIVAGISNRPNEKVDWNGGLVEGVITTEPDRQSMIAKLFGSKVILRPMLVSKTGLGGLRTPEPPSLSKIRSKIANNGSYAVQWFLFAAAAAIIYGLALRKKMAGT
ncbi:SURF1 family protein [Sphingorhabdus sp. IMCC26285]|jgi:surfeit locus 1 family protein|uniref:SURF1-like protein n=1 Tax=Sphingorhabdus profundilacus TaxID=2509718 RepID=A0A6I4M258_9SPHN|nr:SURF1 family cytochrome oxidase biogenesis protein [Sphingorhabdus profundilacus]MVZ98276.1 SURF1 family protein [Sphingorhabdus profundilacus]